MPVDLNEFSVGASSRHLLRWLLEDALVVWDRHGVDRGHGGFFETLSWVESSGELTSEGVIRRGRVVARQIFAFDAGVQLGWHPVNDDPVRHGVECLFSRFHCDGGRFHTAIEVGTWRPSQPFSLYEHAFYLLSLARIKPSFDPNFPVAATGMLALRELQRHRCEGGVGFVEGGSSTQPRQSNPHMHLLEAALAWLAVCDESEQGPWYALAAELVDLCLERFIDPRTGAVREYFDGGWQPLPDVTGRIIEPGHQFEWAWLLMQWLPWAGGTAARRQSLRQTAARLVDIGESSGVDTQRRVAINELWDDLSPKDRAAKVWPQTERVKAWCAMLTDAQTSADEERALRSLAAAAEGLIRYLRTDAPGLWHEVLSPDGEFPPQPCKASSFYHIVGAIDVLQRTVAAYAPAVKPQKVLHE